jgi:hypothetical protein
MRLRTPLLAASFALLTSFTWSSVAVAQATPPDIVKLKDGSMFRGTIGELVTGDHVDLTTANGQTRRFAMKDVAYAGSATAAQPAVPPPPLQPPPPPPPPPGDASSMITVNGQRAELHFDANESDVQFQLRTGQAEMVGVGYGWRTSFIAQASSYTTICTAPCSGSLPTGTHHIGLSHNGRMVIEPDEPTVITGSGTLHGTYTSHLGLRVAGLLVDIASVAVGVTLMVTAIHTSEDCTSGACIEEDSVDDTKIGVGIGVLVVGSLVGTVLMLQRDTADISFVPMGPMASSGSRELSALRAPAYQPQGMALQLRF